MRVFLENWVLDAPGGGNSFLTADPFAILGLPRRFLLSPNEVHRAHLSRIAALHPDRAGGDGLSAAELNDAKEVLLNPESRANALLALLGGRGGSEDRSLPDGFLVEVMEVREAMESGGVKEHGEWRAWAMERRRQHERNVADALESRDLRGARRHLNAWRYIERMIEQLDERSGA